MERHKDFRVIPNVCTRGKYLGGSMLRPDKFYSRHMWNWLTNPREHALSAMCSLATEKRGTSRTYWMKYWKMRYQSEKT